ncbi:MAG TPA: hypothetical protein DCK98_06535 [Chloroflexi bacterium]|nr:hypothetical protein [Chloroflexota bacterium]
MRRARALFVDMSAFRSERDFRVLALGQVASEMGRQVLLIAMPYEVYVRTGSTFAVGLLALVQVASLLGLSLPGGALADTLDRRRILVVTQAALAAFTVLLLAGSRDPATPLWTVYLAAFVIAATIAIARPAQKAALFTIVTRERLNSAVALDQTANQLASVLGPALGGILIGTIGLPAAYALAAASFLCLGVAALLIRQSLAAGTAGLSRLRAIREGVTYVRRTPVVASTMVMDFTAMLFGFPVALFPALALSVFGVGAPGLGLLVSAIAIGALIASVLSGPLTAMRHKGVGVTVLFATWGTAIALFGLATFSFPLALLFLAIAGAADIAAAVLRASIVQSTIPDNMRGRVTSINSLIATAGPRLGDFEATVVAGFTSVPFSVVSGGILCVLGTLAVARAFPQLLAFGKDRTTTTP